MSTSALPKFILSLALLLASSSYVACESSKKETTVKAVPEMTFAMIKPGAVRDKNIGSIIKELENSGFRVVGLKMVQLTPERARLFYQEHKDRTFFPDLIASMTSGPVVAIALEGEDAQTHLRKIVGETDPAKAAKGTIRRLFGKSVTDNSIHASDSKDSAAREVRFFFTTDELYVLPRPVK